MRGIIALSALFIFGCASVEHQKIADSMGTGEVTAVSALPFFKYRDARQDVTRPHPFFNMCLNYADPSAGSPAAETESVNPYASSWEAYTRLTILAACKAMTDQPTLSTSAGIGYGYGYGYGGFPLGLGYGYNPLGASVIP